MRSSYTDGLHVAAEQFVGPEIIHMLDARADLLVPDLTGEPSWPRLRVHLLALAAETGDHPLLQLQTAAFGRDLRSADMAAVLDWRLPELAPTDPGPLPWLPGIAAGLHDHPVWGEYLAKRSQLVIGLADQVRDQAGLGGGQPVWAPPGCHLPAAVIGEVAVWRAAVGIDRRDHRPTGPGQLQTAAAVWQQHLDRRITHPGDDPVSLDPGRGQVGSSIFQDRNRVDRQHPWRPKPRPTSLPPRSR